MLLEGSPYMTHIPSNNRTQLDLVLVICTLTPPAAAILTSSAGLGLDAAESSPSVAGPANR